MHVSWFYNYITECPITPSYGGMEAICHYYEMFGPFVIFFCSDLKDFFILFCRSHFVLIGEVNWGSHYIQWQISRENVGCHPCSTKYGTNNNNAYKRVTSYYYIWFEVSTNNIEIGKVYFIATLFFISSFDISHS